MKLLMAGLLALVATTVHAQAPARMLSGFPPGGAVDILARVFAEEWSKAIGRPVIVENVTGAGGLLAMQNLKSAAPDGNTLAVSPDSSLVVYPHTVAKPAYDTFSDFTPIAHTGASATALAIGAGVPARTLAEFAAWAKANPDKSSFAASGAGSALQFYGALIGQVVGMPMVHVAYRGVGPSVADVVGGQIAATVAPLGPLKPHMSSGKVRALAHSGDARLAGAPDVPTFKELGYAGLEWSAWFGIFGPSGMSTDTAARLNGLFVQAMKNPSVRERMERLDLEVRDMNVGQFAAQVRTDHERWGRVVRAAGWTPTQ